jgi:hypothetical protein
MRALQSKKATVMLGGVAPDRHGMGVNRIDKLACDTAHVNVMADGIPGLTAYIPLIGMACSAWYMSRGRPEIEASALPVPPTPTAGAFFRAHFSWFRPVPPNLMAR